MSQPSDAAPAAADLQTAICNVPNRITAARLVVTVATLIAIQLEAYGWALVLFSIAAGTDYVDGYLARAWNQITQLGRILDPLADKVLICGTFIYLSAIPSSGVPAWLTVIVVCRELIVTVIRSFLEQQGHDFSAKMSGKLKMVLQCATVIASLLLLWQGESAWSFLPGLVTILVWASMITTVYSGVIYAIAAARILR